jgi:alpha-galactosidase
MDWVISVDEPAQVRLLPLETVAGERRFSMLVIGSEISFRFRPRFFQKHRGLEYFEPWTFRVWDKPVVGWCSWFAYYDSVSELRMKRAADVLSETLKQYGLEYVQMDDGYQRNPVGWPDRWLIPNEKFPSGLKNLSDYIGDRGLLPGIWTNTSVHQDSMVRANASLFVEEEPGKPSKSNWIGYSLDGSNEKAIDDVIRPLYRGLRTMGWKYFKVDALRHLRYEGYNSHASFFARKNLDPVEAFRTIVKAVRSEIGRENFMLACWGVRPELIGIIDGCRLGGDGFSFAGMAQYNSFNNIVWRNDPDHIELSDAEAYRSCMVTSLTGSLFMLTDRPERYATEWVEAARRSIPVMLTLPGQLYDVDPSRSKSLDRVGSEMSGSGERVFDASRSTPVDLFMLEVNRAFENWVLLGRVGEGTSFIRFGDLGLDERKEYAVFEFWTKTYLGSFGDGFDPGRVSQKFGCQLFCIRERTGRPQLLATSRHITCGSYEMATLSWSQKTLTGMSTMLPGEPYVLYILEPVGMEFEHAECDGARIVETSKVGLLRTIVLRPDRLKTVDWTIQYH